MNCKGIFSRKLFVRQLDQYFDMTKVYYTVYKIYNVYDYSVLCSI